MNFWATWCIPCREEMPAMETLYREFKDEGFVVLAVNVEESPNKVTKFVREFHVTFPIALDTKGDVMSDYGIRALPATYLIGKKGEVLAMGLGSRDWANYAYRSLFQSLLGLPQ